MPEAPQRHRTTFELAIRGSTQVLIGEAVALPSGLLTVAFLTRWLGHEGYGLFTLAAAAITWIEWSVSSALSRGSVLALAEASDRCSAAAAVIRIHFFTGLAAGVTLLVAADLMARAFGMPQLAGPLKLSSIDIPLFILGQACRCVLVGSGSFGARAVMAGVRWIARLVAIVLFVSAQVSVEAAVLGSIVASMAELAVGLWFIRLSWNFAGLRSRQLHPIFRTLGPLALYDLGLRSYDKVPLFAVGVLLASPAEAGLYGAAQNVALLPGLISMSFGPVLLSSLAAAVRDGRVEEARTAARQSIGVAFSLLPFSALVAGSANEVTVLAFGESFRTAAPIMSLLGLAAVALVLVSMGTATVAAAGRLWWPPVLAISMLILATGGCVAVIPRFGIQGAAIVTAVVACLGGAAAVVGVERTWNVRPSGAIFVTSTLLSSAIFSLSLACEAHGPLLLAKLSLGFLAMGGMVFAATRRASSQRVISHET